MKFYLSSYHLGDEPERLSALRQKNNRVAVVQNALDAYTDLERRERGLQREFADLKAIGLVAEELDLRLFFGRAAELQKYIEAFGYLWVTGSNAFVLRRAFSLSGIDSILQKKIQEDDFVYSGYSAGICVLALERHSHRGRPSGDAEGLLLSDHMDWLRIYSLLYRA